ncbi:MAG: hypothetical protein R6X25_03380 [Candidatus Krumholzibacteriia bacterium]
MNKHSLLARSGAVAFLLVVALAVAGCGDGGETEQVQSSGTADARSQQVSGQQRQDGGDEPVAGAATTLAGVTFRPPDGWRALGASGMRQAQYERPPVEGDRDPAEVNVYYFGPQAGGAVDANLQRWIGQMIPPGGGDPGEAAERSGFEVDGMTAHVVSIDGTYDPGTGRAMGAPAGPQENYRLVGIVLEAPGGNLFFKLTGPQATAHAMEDDLLAMIRSVERAGD